MDPRQIASYMAVAEVVTWAENFEYPMANVWEQNTDLEELWEYKRNTSSALGPVSNKHALLQVEILVSRRVTQWSVLLVFIFIFIKTCFILKSVYRSRNHIQKYRSL